VDSVARLAGVYTAELIVATVFFWKDDPALRGIDDFPPLAGIVLLLPFVLVAMALGAAVRSRWGTRRSA
jgi:hypothetical protein